MTPEEAELYQQAIKEGLVVMAPRSLKNLRDQYPELNDKKKYPQFAELSSADMMFVFLFRGACSPFVDMEDKDKLEKCIRLAYRSEQVRGAKLAEWIIQDNGEVTGFKGKFPAALSTMSKFNASARIVDYQAMMILRKNCLQVIANKTPGKDYISEAAAAMRTLQETTAILEAGSFGVEQKSNTILPSLMGSLADHRSTQ